MRGRFTIPLLALGMLVGVTPAGAFHSQGVGNCNGCHVMHEDPAMGTAPAQPGLLREGNATDVCLRCHETGHGNTWGANLLLPGQVYGGGSFIFLLEQNLNDGSNGLTVPIPGRAAGHNVVSPSRGTVADTEYSTSPGGSYPSASLTCTSCHDPHDKGGNYRMLYGSGSPDSQSDGYVFPFVYPAPTAVGIDVDGAPESVTLHNAYQGGMTRWCANCHGLYHEDVGRDNFRHKVERTLGGGIRKTYDEYDGTGVTNPNPASSYLPMVPYESQQNTTGYRGPTPSDAAISCVSCHRAHASSGPQSGRWDFNIASWYDEGRISGSYPIPNPYLNTSGPNQRRLCEKCHGDNVPGPDRPPESPNTPPDVFGP